MPWPRVTRALIVAVGAAAVAFATFYGPSRRIYASPRRAVAVSTVAEACELWAREGVRGRVALVFARDLMPAQYGPAAAQAGGRGPGVDAIVRAMHHGLVREVWHVVPDGAWDPIALNLMHVTIYWSTERGLVGAFEDGRVDVVPFSRLPASAERALVIVDATAWSRQDLAELALRLRLGVIAADLVAVVGGDAEDVALLDSAVTAGSR